MEMMWCWAESKLTFTYSMVHSPSWEANWFAASQEIPRISRNSKVHYRTHKCPSAVSIPGQLTPVHIPTSHFLEIHPNIIHPSTPMSPQWSPSLRFHPIYPLSSPIRATFTRPKKWEVSCLSFSPTMSKTALSCLNVLNSPPPPCPSHKPMINILLSIEHWI